MFTPVLPQGCNWLTLHAWNHMVKECAVLHFICSLHYDDLCSTTGRLTAVRTCTGGGDCAMLAAPFRASLCGRVLWALTLKWRCMHMKTSHAL